MGGAEESLLLCKRSILGWPSLLSSKFIQFSVDTYVDINRS